MTQQAEKIDMHFHVSSQPEDWECLGRLAQENHIHKAVAFGMNTGSARGCDRNTMALQQRWPELIIPFACDFSYQRDDLEYGRRCLQNGFWGFGELLIGHGGARKDGLGGMRYDDPVPLALFRVAAEYEAPVLVHCDPPYADSMEQALAYCPDTTFIWAHMAYHFGAGLNAPMPDKRHLISLLERFPGLYFDIAFWQKSALCLMDYIDLLEAYPHRFVWGLDMTGRYEMQFQAYMRDYLPVFEALKPETRRAILHDNMMQILKNRAEYMGITL